MTEKLKVKVIKKGDVKASTPTLSKERKTKRIAARAMVSTVTNWVSDFQTRKRDETKLAIEKLFAHQPQPNES
ncbi:MAG: hypothetical protein ACT4O9_04655 [Blastocatellia bacterium]